MKSRSQNGLFLFSQRRHIVKIPPESSDLPGNVRTDDLANRELFQRIHRREMLAV